MGLAALLAAATLATTPAGFVTSHQQADGGFTEPGSQSTPGLTAWSTFGLRAAGRSSGKAGDYLVAHEHELQTATDIELALIAEAALGRVSEPLYERFAALLRPDGRIGPAINSTAWGILAYAQVGARSSCASRICFANNSGRAAGAGSPGARRIPTTPRP